MSTHLTVRIQVEDFGKWKPHFESHKKARLEHGLHLLNILQNKENKNDVTVHLEVKNEEKAKQFLQSDNLRQTMKKAGVIGKPEVTFHHASTER